MIGGRLRDGMSRGQGASEIEFLSFATNHVSPVARLDAPLFKTDPGLAVSPDERWLLVVQMDESGSDIVMAENFR